MKQARRKELKTNALSIYLQQVYETASRNATYLIGGVVVVVLVLVVALMVWRNRLAVQEDAWRTYYSIRDQSAAVTPELLDQARLLAATNAQDRDLGPRVLQQKADLAYALAITLSPNLAKERRTELFNEAKAAYEQQIRQFISQPDVVARSRLSLASVEESLAIASGSDGSAARRLYQEVIDSGVSAFRADAETRLASLDDRLTRLPIVASRPAEPAAIPPSAPAIQTMPATAPAATTMPTTRP